MDELTRQIIDSPEFKRLLKRRSRLRWGFTALLVVSYVLYGLAGVWFPEAMARPFMGSAMSWIMAIAYSIMALAVVTALWYVRIIGKLHNVRRRGSE
ncbi:MAG: DUF485 domain-containing protein [Gammaproteobacteria bacterium]|nr:DUF485 domain-containing protein [Gammaproteobacteria bacterium]